MTWYTSNRKAELPANWYTVLRPAAKRRARGQCEHMRDGTRCTNIGTELHHLGDKHDHRLAALQWICADCHKHETQRQSQDARGIGAGRKRPPARHPGLIG